MTKMSTTSNVSCNRISNFSASYPKAMKSMIQCRPPPLSGIPVRTALYRACAQSSGGGGNGGDGVANGVATSPTTIHGEMILSKRPVSGLDAQVWNSVDTSSEFIRWTRSRSVPSRRKSLGPAADTAAATAAATVVVVVVVDDDDGVFPASR